MLLSFVHTASFQRPYVRDFLRQRSLCLSSSSWTFPAWICTAPSWDRFCFGIHNTLLHLRPQTTKAHNCTGILGMVCVFNLFYFGFYIVWLKTNQNTFIGEKKVKLYGFWKTHNVQWSQLCFPLYEENKQHHCDIFISFKHIICNKRNEVQGIPILSPPCKVITNTFLRTTPVTQKKSCIQACPVLPEGCNSCCDVGGMTSMDQV